MDSIAHQLTQTIWLVEHSTDNIWLLELLLENWGYNSVRIQDSAVLAPEIKSKTVKPQLIILSIAPSQNNAVQLIERFRQDRFFSDIPLLCLCTSSRLCADQVMAAGASDVLYQPFELDALHRQLLRLLKPVTDSDQSKPSQEMTFLLSEAESASLIPQQQHWSEVFEQHSEPDAWQLLAAAGYEVEIPIVSSCSCQ